MLREDAATGGVGSLGFLFDITQLVPYVQKYGSSPISGRKVSLKDVLTVNMHRNNEGAYHCPILNKVFTEHTAIVASLHRWWQWCDAAAVFSGLFDRGQGGGGSD